MPSDFFKEKESKCIESNSLKDQNGLVVENFVGSINFLEYCFKTEFQA
jgi:hypothetical protein